MRAMDMASLSADPQLSTDQAERAAGHGEELSESWQGALGTPPGWALCWDGGHARQRSLLA